MTANTNTEQHELRNLIADDGFACSFQTLGQYRSALLKAINLRAGAALSSPALQASAAPVAGDDAGLTTKEAWWAGYRAGKGVPPDTPRQAALAASPVLAQSPVAAAPDMLRVLDDAFEAEIQRVSSVAYNSNEICRHFFAKVRERIAAAPQVSVDEREAFEQWASDPVRSDKLPLDRWPTNGGYKDYRTYIAFYGWKSGRAALSPAPAAQQPLA
jgi:hypothetical protein